MSDGSLLIRASSIYKSFGSRLVIRDANLIVQRRTLTVLVGPSGCGKSTLMGIVAGFIAPDTGAIEHSAQVGPLRFGFVPQSSNALSSRTTIDNAMLGALAAGARRREACRDAYAHLALVGLEHLSNVGAGKLSGGELQRLALARAFGAHPDVVFADEPTGNLDAASTAHVCDCLRLLVDQGPGALIATHDPTVMARADVVIDLGEFSGGDRSGDG